MAEGKYEVHWTNSVYTGVEVSVDGWVGVLTKWSLVPPSQLDFLFTC